MTFLRTRGCIRFVGITLALLLIPACDSQEDDNGPPVDRLETTTVTTGSGGSVTFDLAGYDVSVTTESPDGNPVPDIDVSAAVTQRFLVVITEDPRGNYQPGIRIIRLEDVTSDSIPVELSLLEVGLLVQLLGTSPAYIEDLREEEGFTEECTTGTIEVVLSDIQAVPASESTLGHIFHLTALAASSLGYDGPRTATVSDEFFDADLALVVALMGEVFGIFNEDVQTVCWGTDDEGVPVTPFYWTELEIDRDFAMRLTLTWDENPDDLDSHLFTPEIDGSAHHVYFASRGSQSEAPFAELDVDDVTSFGPENVTIDEFRPGTYHYAIYHYGGEGTITTSGAVVKVFTAAGLQHTLTVPTGNAGENWWWHVLEINGATGAVTIVNTINEGPPVGEAEKGAPWPDKR